MVEIGQVIEFTFSEDNKQYYFRTSKSEKRYGIEYQIFCACKPADEIDFTDFWGMTEKFYDEMLAKGMLREVG